MATPTMVTILGDLAPAVKASRVRFYIPQAIRYANGPDVLLPQYIDAPVNQTDGTFTVQIPGTNDPNWSPSNWTMKVTIEGDNLNLQYDVQVPYNAGTMNFSALLPAVAASLGTLYAPFSHGNHVLALPTGDPVPPGTPPNTVIVRY